jgi:hypothetical protein
LATPILAKGVVRQPYGKKEKKIKIKGFDPLGVIEPHLRATRVIQPPLDRPAYGWPNHPHGPWGWLFLEDLALGVVEPPPWENPITFF